VRTSHYMYIYIYRVKNKYRQLPAYYANDMYYGLSKNSLVERTSRKNKDFFLFDTTVNDNNIIVSIQP